MSPVLVNNLLTLGPMMLQNHTSTRDLGTRAPETLMLSYVCRDFIEELVSGLLPGITKIATESWNFVYWDFIYFLFLMQDFLMNTQKVLDLRFLSDVFLNRTEKSVFLAVHG